MKPNNYFIPGVEVALRGVGKQVYWAYPTVVVQDTAELLALYLPAGAVGKDTPIKPTPQELLDRDNLEVLNREWNQNDVLILVCPGEAFGVYLMWAAGTKKVTCWYINLQDPIRRTRIGFDTMDHMLDVVVNPGMSEWQWKDEAELAEAERLGIYTPDEARWIWAQGEKAVNLMLTERRTFYQVWERWRTPVEWRTPKLSSEWDRLDL